MVTAKRGNAGVVNFIFFSCLYRAVRTEIKNDPRNNTKDH